MDANQQLWESITKGDLKSVVNAIDAGADLNLADGYGKTPLMIACSWGNEDIVKTLIMPGFKSKKTLVAAGADLFKKDENGRTALFYAAEKGNDKIIDIFLAWGTQTQRLALLEIEDLNGEDAAVYAEGFGHPKTAKKIKAELTRIENKE